MAKTAPDEQRSDYSYASLGALGGLMIIGGVAALASANAELPILGAGLLPAGLLLLVGRAGGRRNWSWFPFAPLLLATLICGYCANVFLRHMKERRAPSTAPADSAAPAAPVQP